jgi:uncharacterized Zn finger protein (UPF0148 family)
MKNDNLEYIKCPRCGWHGAVKDKKTGLITCQYCMYRTKRRKNERDSKNATNIRPNSRKQ